jgi:hypothetical protein
LVLPEPKLARKRGKEKARTAIVDVLTVLQTQNLEPNRTNLSFPGLVFLVLDGSKFCVSRTKIGDEKM